MSASPSVTTPLRRTPLHDEHVALGAKIVPFAGFEMPVQYAGGITVEHRAVREQCGMFDVSHMGEVLVRGPDAMRFVARVTSNDVEALDVGQIHYSTLLREDGTIVDDLLVYRYADHLMLVINASNREKDLAHLRTHVTGFDCTLTDVSDETALLAIQGPWAASVVQSLTDANLAAIRYYWFGEGRVAGVPCTISRTGYTGEDGFELYCADTDARALWERVMATGRVTPAGLGARDTLRLEAGLCLYGNEMHDRTTPLDAGLGWLVKWNKREPFLGRDVLVQQKTHGTARKLVGFTFDERAIPRHGYPVFHDGAEVGEVCSGTMSPTLERPIGTAYVPTALARVDATFDVDIRGKRVTARVVKLPFYKRAVSA
jgi:aminomethyltransferase